ncbi:MAG: hypothetical protein EXR36_10040 [Betaproteobacteria bacterium]|nr:hypothetical protein [Betaproteobacteria bacterium]
MRACKFFLLWAALCAGQQALAQEVPLDCARPESWAEQTICADNELAEIRVRVQRAYEERRSRLGEGAQAELVSYQRGWLRGREECRTAGDAAAAVRCLKDLYGARLSQLASAEPRVSAAVPAPDPALIACRGDGASWAMEMGASSARLHTDGPGTAQMLSGKLSVVPEQKTYTWRGSVTPDGAEVVALVLESACALDGSRARFPLVARVSLPGGNLLAGCCQRTPVAALREAPPAKSPLGHTLGPLLPAGTQIRLRNVDGATVPLRKSARISSGNILTKVKAGITATVEQGIVQEGMNWYFISFPHGDLKGWVMGELVEGVQPGVEPPAQSAGQPPAAVGPQAPVTAEPVAPRVAVREKWIPVRGNWWRGVVSYLPFIDACIRKAQARTARIVNVEATKDSLDVYLRDQLHQRIACTVQTDGTVQARAVNMDEHFPASGPIFTRAPGAPPNPTCYSSKRVMDPNTRSSAGWLSTLKPGKRCR